MEKLDAGRGKLRILDITAPDFDPSRYGSMDDLMGQIHGVTREGKLVTGLEVFRRVYRALADGGGLRARAMSALVSVTGWPLVRNVADRGYRWFARNRLGISARAARVLGDEPELACEGDRCKVP